MSGQIIYHGPSMIDGAEIIVIATSGSKNEKTGNMVQTRILGVDVAPHIAARDGRDVSICGDCALRTNPDTGKRACYVRTHEAPLSVTAPVGYLAILPSLPFIDSDRAAVLRTLVTRGPRKGMPLRAPPSPAKDAAAFAAWHGWHAAAHAARWGYLPNDCGVYGMMLPGHAEVFDRVFDVILVAARAAITKAKQ